MTTALRDIDSARGASHWSRPSLGGSAPVSGGPERSDSLATPHRALSAQEWQWELRPSPHRRQKVEYSPRSARVRVRGETFFVEIDEEAVYLTHPRWSLSGVGATLGEAQLDLLQEAQAVAESLVDFDDGRLDGEAQKMRRFVLEFLTLVQ